MNFNCTLAKKDGHEIVIIEHSVIIEKRLQTEHWILSVSPFMVWFEKAPPFIRGMVGMTLTAMSETEAIRMLRKYANNQTVGCAYKIKEFLEYAESLS